jgi:serine/threonine protein kinase
VTYLAYDLILRHRVAIKEYFPRGLAMRDYDRATLLPNGEADEHIFRYGLQQFMQEAQILARFDHPNIVRVIHCFEANGTGYLVMPYHEGTSLRNYLTRRGGKLPEALAVGIAMAICDALRYVHAGGVLHRDIDPSNIFLTKTGVPLLLDFGAARVAVGERSKNITAILKPGYAPYEQYGDGKSKSGPWTDVYGMAATLYEMVTGTVPPESVERLVNDSLIRPRVLIPALSDRLEKALLKGLAVKPQKRPRTVEAFQALLPLNVDPQTEPASMTRDMNFIALYQIVMGALVCLTLVGALWGIPTIIAGLRLREAARLLNTYESTGDSAHLTSGFDHQRQYFFITKVLTIVGIVLSLLWLIVLLLVA